GQAPPFPLRFHASSPRKRCDGRTNSRADAVEVRTGGVISGRHARTGASRASWHHPIARRGVPVLVDLQQRMYSTCTGGLMAVTIIALGGSLGQQSTSLAAVRVALDGAREAGARTELFDVRELDVPMYTPQVTDVPAAARRFSESVYAC